MLINQLLLKHQKLIEQAIRFITVGFINTGVDYIIYFILTRKSLFFQEYYLLANAISFSCAVINSFFLNNYWTFGSNDKFKWRIFLQYVLIYIVGSLLIAEMILFVTVDIFKVYDLIGKLVAIVVGFLWNFTILKKYLFNTKQEL